MCQLQQSSLLTCLATLKGDPNLCFCENISLFKCVCWVCDLGKIGEVRSSEILIVRIQLWTCQVPTQGKLRVDHRSLVFKRLHMVIYSALAHPSTTRLVPNPHRPHFVRPSNYLFFSFLIDLVSVFSRQLSTGHTAMGAGH